MTYFLEVSRNKYDLCVLFDENVIFLRDQTMFKK